MAVNYTSPRFSAEDDNGRPLIGGRLLTYQNGSTTPAPTYKDAAGAILNTNPIILDARGEAVVHLLPAQVYRFVLQNRFGSIIWSQDGITGATSSSDFADWKALLAGGGGADLVGYLDDAAGAEPISIGGILSNRADLDYFGVKGDGTTDDSKHLEDAVNSGKKVIEGYGNKRIRITRPITLNGVTLKGNDGMASALWRPAVANGSDGGHPAADLQGSWIFFDGDITENAIRMEGSSKLQGFGFWYPENTPDKWTLIGGGGTGFNGEDVYSPKQFAAAVHIEGNQAYLQDLMFINAYDAIFQFTADKLSMQDVSIAPSHFGLLQRELGAGGQTINVNVYPFWSQAYNFAGLMNRVNLYADNYGTAIQQGMGDGVARIIEEMMFVNTQIIGVASGVKMAGKGSILTNSKIDNCPRCVEVRESDNSTNHQIIGLWASSFYGYDDAVRPADFYIIANSGGGQLNIQNVTSPRSDGFGLYLPFSVNKTTVKNVHLDNNGYCGVTLCTASDRVRQYVTMDTVHIGTRSAGVVAFQHGDMANSSLRNLTYSGPTTTPYQYTGTAGRQNLVGVDIDLPQLAQTKFSTGDEIRRGSTTAFITGNNPASTVPYAFSVGYLQNAGATGASTEFRVANLDTTGGGAALASIATSAGGGMTSIIDFSVAGVRPSFNGAFPLGTASMAWSNVYGVNAYTATSDARLKTPIQNLSDAEIAAGLEIAESIGTFQWLNKVSSDDPMEGDKARHHFGVTVQNVMAIMDNHGLDAMKYGIVGHESWNAQDEIIEEIPARDAEIEVIPAEDAVLDADGNVVKPAVEASERVITLARPASRRVVQPAREAGDIYHLRGQELAMLVARAQGSKLADLEARITKLEKPGDEVT